MLRKEKPKYKSVVISPQKSPLFVKECMEGGNRKLEESERKKLIRIIVPVY